MIKNCFYSFIVGVLALTFIMAPLSAVIEPAKVVDPAQVEAVDQDQITPVETDKVQPADVDHTDIIPVDESSVDSPLKDVPDDVNHH